MTRFTELTSPQIADLLGGLRTPVLLLPVGAVEAHGPHAPLATDTFISLGMCDRAAAELADDDHVRALVLPALPYGVTRYAASFPGTVSVSEDALHRALVDVCAGLVQQGLRWIVLVNNHFEPAHVQTLHRAVETMQEEYDAHVGFLDLVRRSNAEKLTEEFRSGSCHAGRYETSLVLADHPELVDVDRAHELPALPVDMPAAMRDGNTDFLAMGMADAYCGAPADATADEGAATFGTLTQMLIETIRAVAREDGGSGGMA